MKQTITLSIIAMLFFSLTSNAQINKGSIMLGGDFGGNFNSAKDPDTVTNKANNFSISPSIGFAVANNTIVGFSLLYGFNNNKYYGEPEMKGHSYGAGVFLRKYKPLSKNFYLFGEGEIMYTHASYNYSIHNSSFIEYDSKADGIALNITPGIAYNLTNCIQLEASLQNLLSLGYSSTKEKAIDTNQLDYKSSSVYLNSSLNPISLSGISLGIRFWINK
jgi:hypothetical protein